MNGCNKKRMNYIKNWRFDFMAILKVINNDYPDYNSVEHLISYVLDGANGFTGQLYSQHIYPLNSFAITRQMCYVSRFFGKDNRRLVRHIVIAYEDYLQEYIGVQNLLKNIWEFMLMYFPQNQWIIAPHEKDERIHVHIVYNLTNFYDCKQINESGGFFTQLAYGFSCHGIMVKPDKMKHIKYNVIYGKHPKF